MKREIIHITEDGKIVIPAVHPDKIRMDEAELVSLFNVVAPTLRAAKRRIYKLEILQPFTAEQRIPLKEGYQVVYNLRRPQGSHPHSLHAGKEGRRDSRSR